VRALCVALLCLASACFDDHYECEQDSDCDLGVGGRCEVTHHCTVLDTTCELTGRRYSAHSGSDADACWVGTIALANPCASGQPPAIAEGCAATVCSALPTCCKTGWSDACVLEAQQHCGIQCDTRIAITATKGQTTELWDLRYDGTAWTAKPRVDREGLLAYLAPAPGTTEPRLAGLSGPTLAIETGDAQLDLPLYPDHVYQDVHSVDFERDTRDTIVLSAGSPNGNFAEVAKLDGQQPRLIPVAASLRETWGDYDGDAYPDGVAGAAVRYHFLANFLDKTTHERMLNDQTSSDFFGLDTPNTPAIRSFEWIDVNHDGFLDLIAYGNALAVHVSDTVTVSNRSGINWDCTPLMQDPPAIDTCTSMTTIAGAARPTPTGVDVLVATIPTRKLYRVVPRPTPPMMSLVPDPCPTCGPVVAVVVRDLDGNGVLDTVTIDNALRLMVDMNGNGFIETRPIMPMLTGFGQVRTSVSGALR
jgi:hypothetical protein